MAGDLDHHSPLTLRLLRPLSPIVLLVALAVPDAHAQQADAIQARLGFRKAARAVEVNGERIRLDGRLDEPVWAEAAPIDDFVQKEPIEGVLPTERTEVRFVYDERALYVGARMYTSGGRSEIQAPLGRRDDNRLAESILLSLDTFLDRRTAY